ncbi:hypothetical protein BOTBODRAFT_445377 [Botryobasidium botryosum FD-172 SS1]|uniref:F-box domain-containing protein n=1 Tax=Botryobasidium botryosum (strain FD-172 SS1) TaxID=930990 RepID=A0A067N7B4_BOTB1|nr:hypothetical protein BOTBODRAFT_445377 [Botryobasidium botryosum FD-172 SS1]
MGLSLTGLNEDVLLHTISYLNTFQSLLSLASTCRLLHKLVVPEYLYKTVFLPLSRPCSKTEALERGPRWLFEPGSTVGHAARSLTLRGPYMLRDSWLLPAEAVPQAMPHLSHIAITDYLHSGLIATVSEILARQPHLISLSLKCAFRGLEPPPTLRLHTFDLYDWTSDAVYIVGHHTPLGVFLLSQRQTLRHLSLHAINIEWELKLTEGEELVWLHVTELELDISSIDPMCYFHIAHAFPSVQHYHTTEPQRSWIAQQPNLPFIRRLESLSGEWEDMKHALDVGARLRRIIVSSSDLTEGIDLEACLPQSIQGLTLTIQAQHCQVLEVLASAAPSLEYLAINIKAGWHSPSNTQKILQYINAVASRFASLRYLSVSLYWVDRPDLTAHSDTFTGIAAAGSCPSLCAISLSGSDDRELCWRRIFDSRDGHGRFVQVSEEDGEESRKYYDWPWVYENEN